MGFFVQPEYAAETREFAGEKPHTPDVLFVISGFRFYDPSTGRWLSRDPLGDFVTLQRLSAGKSKSEAESLFRESLAPTYLFVSNRPTQVIDPVGLTAVDFWQKSRTGRLRKMWGIDFSGSAVVGHGGTISFQGAFFPDTCELGFYAILPAAAGTGNSPDRSPLAKVFLDFPIGLDASISLNASAAIFRGPGFAGANSWEGVFYGGNAGGGFLGDIGVGAFWDPNGWWIGGSAGVGLSATPISAKTNPQMYYLVKQFRLPDPLCLCLILGAP